ncbi:MAG TPA: tetratricopeptide repeat protein, partial [Candidatus Methylomirabilis sp.]|nr:tetratricopeptide repeat protein [Candidatus Methylomirabilis sp.]
YHQSIWQRAYTFCLAVWNYLRLLFVPTGLHMEWQITPVANFWSWPVIGLIFLGAAAIIIAVKTWKKNRLIAFGLSWFVLGLLPHANLIETNRPLYEHWLYLPMVGFWLAFFCLIFILFDKIKNERARDWSLKIFCVIVIAYVLFLTALTIARNRDWHDPITFYEKNLKYSPQSFIEHNNLGMAYAEAGRINEAIVQYRQAIAISDVYPQVHYNLANSLANAQKFAEAEKEYQNAIAMDPGFILPYQNLYNLYLYEGKKDEAKKILKEINLSK